MGVGADLYCRVIALRRVELLPIVVVVDWVAWALEAWGVGVMVGRIDQRPWAVEEEQRWDRHPCRSLHIGVAVGRQRRCLSLRVSSFFPFLFVWLNGVLLLVDGC